MNNKQPLVTIIIPSYNHAQYIENAIESVKNQTYNNWELIIIDDGSTDNTHEVLRNLSFDSRITIILNKSNKKQSARLNQAIKLAKGKFISLLASDDWYLPEKTELQINQFNKLSNEYGVVYSGGYRFFEDTGQITETKTNNDMKRGWILKNLLLEPFFIYPISPLVRKSCFQTYPFDETYFAEGEAIYFKIAMKYKFDFIDKPLVIMRDHTYNIGGNIERMLEDNVRYRQDLFLHKDFPIELMQYKGIVLGKIYKLKGWEYIRIKKNYTKGKSALINAIKVNKLLIFDKRIIVGLFLSFLPKSFSNFINR